MVTPLDGIGLPAAHQLCPMALMLIVLGFPPKRHFRGRDLREDYEWSESECRTARIETQGKFASSPLSTYCHLCMLVITP